MAACLFWKGLIHNAIHSNESEPLHKNTHMLYTCVSFNIYNHTVRSYVIHDTYFSAARVIKQRLRLLLYDTSPDWFSQLQITAAKEWSGGWQRHNTSLMPVFKYLHLPQPHKRAVQSGGNRSHSAVQASALLQPSKELLLYACAASLWALWWHRSLSGCCCSHQKYCMAKNSEERYMILHSVGMSVAAYFGCLMIT